MHRATFFDRRRSCRRHAACSRNRVHDPFDRRRPGDSEGAYRVRLSANTQSTGRRSPMRTRVDHPSPSRIGCRGPSDGGVDCAPLPRMRKQQHVHADVPRLGVRFARTRRPILRAGLPWTFSAPVTTHRSTVCRSRRRSSSGHDRGPGRRHGHQDPPTERSGLPPAGSTHAPVSGLSRLLPATVVRGAPRVSGRTAFVSAQLCPRTPGRRHPGECPVAGRHALDRRRPGPRRGSGVDRPSRLFRHED